MIELLLQIALVMAVLFFSGRLLLQAVGLYRQGHRKAAFVRAAVFLSTVLVVLMVSGKLPYQKNLRIQEQIEGLTGRDPWPTHEFAFEEHWGFGPGAGGYRLNMYSFDDGAAEYFSDPDSLFFLRKPIDELAYRSGFSGWQRTPVDSAGAGFLERATQDDLGWEGEVRDRFKQVNAWGRSSGSLYAYRGDHGALEFFLINPAERMFVSIHHNR